MDRKGQWMSLTDMHRGRDGLWTYEGVGSPRASNVERYRFNSDIFEVKGLGGAEGVRSTRIRYQLWIDAGNS